MPKLFYKVSLALGQKTTEDIKGIVDNFLSLETSLWLEIALTIFFYFIATTLLSAVRQSIHQLWTIRKKPTRKADYHIKERLIEVGMILLIGVLFLVGLLSDQGLSIVKDAVPFANHLLASILGVLFSILIISAWFMFFYKLMPEARVSWRVALAGGLLTSTLFALGRITLINVLIHEKVARIFGPSASIALLLLFIFYCSFILYFGAAFTIEYGKVIHEPVKPGPLGEKYRETKVQSGLSHQ